MPAGGFEPAPFSKQASSEAGQQQQRQQQQQQRQHQHQQHSAAAARDAYDAPYAPADRASGAAARAFYEAFAAAEEGHRPAYHHRWSAYATNLFDGSDIEH